VRHARAESCDYDVTTVLHHIVNTSLRPQTGSTQNKTNCNRQNSIGDTATTTVEYSTMASLSTMFEGCLKGRIYIHLEFPLCPVTSQRLRKGWGGWGGMKSIALDLVYQSSCPEYVPNCTNNSLVLPDTTSQQRHVCSPIPNPFQNQGKITFISPN
jgi:hypothetical protein